MGTLEQALAGLGEEIGLPGLAPSELNGRLQLRFIETDALLGILEQDDAAVLYFAQPLRYDIADTLLRAWQRAADVGSATQAVQVGLRSTPQGNWLVVASRFSPIGVDTRHLREKMDFLREWALAVV